MLDAMKIAVLTSGGVDSSVALRLLQQQGHDVTAFYLKIWLEDELSYLGECPWEEDLHFVRQICADANIPLEVLSLQKEYWEEVIAYAVAELKVGHTPNPDVLCNQRIKFGQFYKKIDAAYEKVATGHYARVTQDGTIFYLQKAKDSFKDQTYFLAHLNQAQLARALFPVGDYLKSEVRRLAKEFGLPNQNRKDSQGLCFLGKIPFQAFVRHHLGDKKGDLVERETGKKLGTHNGFWYFTIGQRHGIGLSGGPWFVVEKNIHDNVVFISREYRVEESVRNAFWVRDLHWTTDTLDALPKIPNFDTALEVKVRHGEALYPAHISFAEEGRAHVEITGSDQGFAPGQFAVFYYKDFCLGCGVIDL